METQTKQYCLSELYRDIKILPRKDVKNILRRFLKLMTDDLIYDNNLFVFFHGNIILTVADKPDADDYHYDIERETDIQYQPVIYGRSIDVSWIMQKYNFRMAFSGITQKKFEDEINNGHHY
jgi:hypothetical protein